MDKLSRLIGKKSIRKKKIEKVEMPKFKTIHNSDPILTVDYAAAPPLISYKEIPKQKFETLEDFNSYLHTNGSPVVVKSDSVWYCLVSTEYFFQTHSLNLFEFIILIQFFLSAKS